MSTYGLWCVNCLLYIYSPIKETATSAKTAPTITGTNMTTRLSDSSEGVVGVAAMTAWNRNSAHIQIHEGMNLPVHADTQYIWYYILNTICIYCIRLN